MSELKKNIFWIKIRTKIYKILSLGYFVYKCKTLGGICKTLCGLTEDFDGGGKLINVVQFQEIIEVLLILGDNWRNLQFHRDNCLFTHFLFKMWQVNKVVIFFYFIFWIQVVIFL